MRIVAIFALVISAAAVKTGDEDALGLDLDSESDLMVHPVMKVVNLLKDMKVQLNSDLEEDREVHEKMDCWCDTNEKEKTQAIEDGEIKIQSLEAALGEAAGQIGEMKQKRKEAYADLQNDKKALAEASELRLKEKKAFGKDQADTTVAVASCKNAVIVLKKQNPALVEIRAVASELEKARILQIGGVNNLKRAALKDWLHDAKTATSFLSIPSYGSQSGQIFGILSQMLEDFEGHLSDIQEEEKKAEDNFKELKAVKQGQIDDGQKQVIDLDKRLGATGEKQAQDKKSLDDAEEQLESDKAFMISLKKKCGEGDAEFDVRIKDRTTEIEAVETAIGVINSEGAFNLFGKTLPSFLQTSEGEQLRRQTAAGALERAAAEIDSPILAMLAGRVRLDAFTEVKKAISGMVAELDKQQKDEIEHKDWCVKETNDNTRETAAADDKKDSLIVARDDLKSSIDTISKEIATAHAEVKEIKVQMKRASAVREGANAGYQTTITDQRMTQMVLNKALTTLKSVYALLQHKRSHGRHSAGPEPKGFKKYEKNAGGNAVVALIEGIIGDSKKAEADAIAAEQNAQTTYEDFMTGSNKALEEKAKEIMTKSGNRAKSQEDLNMAKKDLATTKKKLDRLADEKEDLAGSCDFITKNFSKRQAARAAEKDALKEALAILSGAQ